jgi:hypothetical protein
MKLADSIREEGVMKLDVKAFALTCGLVAAIGLLLLNGWIRAFDGPNSAPVWLMHVYRGYSLSLIGSAVGAIWAFFEGFIVGGVFAWLYDAIDSRLVVRHRVSQ